jgi:hypothetical protein
MKYIIASLLIFNSFIFASSAENTKDRQKKNIEEQMKKEQKYAREQTFYKAEDYDLKAAEVDENSLKSIPVKPNINEGFDMNSVYD